MMPFHHGGYPRYSKIALNLTLFFLKRKTSSRTTLAPLMGKNALFSNYHAGNRYFFMLVTMGVHMILFHSLSDYFRKVGI